MLTEPGVLETRHILKAPYVSGEMFGPPGRIYCTVWLCWIVQYLVGGGSKALLGNPAKGCKIMAHLTYYDTVSFWRKI